MEPREDNVFTGIRQSVHGGRGSLQRVVVVVVVVVVVKARDSVLFSNLQQSGLGKCLMFRDIEVQMY